MVLTALVHLLIVPNYALLNPKETSNGTPLSNLIGWWSLPRFIGLNLKNRISVFGNRAYQFFS